MNYADYNELDLVITATSLKEKIAAFDNSDKSLNDKILQKLVLNWNYHSNAIEGNQLTYSETVALIMHGVTAKGKPLKDHLDIQGHNEAIKIIFELVKSDEKFKHKDIKDLHEILLKEEYYSKAKTSTGEIVKRKISVGEYKELPNHVETSTGEIHYYTEPHLVHAEMTDLLDWLNGKEFQLLHPVIGAAIFHHKFVAIRPFDDGNGRLARLLMNLILLRKKYLPAVIRLDRREAYYGVLAQADSGDYQPLIEYVCQCEIESLNVKLAVLEGSEVFSLDDLDKRIALFKASLSPTQKGVFEKNEQYVGNLVSDLVIPLVNGTDDRVRKFADLFQEYKFYSFIRNERSDKRVFTHTNELVRALKSSDFEKLNHIKIQFALQGLKSSSASNSFAVGFDFHFLAYQYQIKVLNDPQNSRELSYGEMLTDEEKSNLVDQLLTKLMASIKAAL